MLKYIYVNYLQKQRKNQAERPNLKYFINKNKQKTKKVLINL